MTLSDNMRLLVELLTQATRKKKIQWLPDKDLTYFGAALEDGSVELLQHPSGDGFNLLVRNNQRLLLDQTGYLSQQASPELAELGREVRASILKSNEGLANIISGLRQKVTEP
ncbi:MAG: hypothetical protein L0Z62_10615 [Gemmataceae bacterium]|nr:hypothetical protein [Gemmataceae bacterium]